MLILITRKVNENIGSKLVNSSTKSPIITDFKVIKESENYIVVSKPAPLIVHPTDLSGQQTLLGGLQALLSYDLANGARLSIITRLDRETSGLVLVAKNKTIARAFSRAMERKEVYKCYQAIIYGNPDWGEITVNQPIGNLRDIKESKIWLKQAVHQNGRQSETYIKVLKRFGKYTLVEVIPKTGRTHQIRVHLSHIGFPILGDKIYGLDENLYLEFIANGWSENMAKLLVLPRHALHAVGLKLNLGEETLQFSTSLDADLTNFLNDL